MIYRGINIRVRTSGWPDERAAHSPELAEAWAERRMLQFERASGARFTGMEIRAFRAFTVGVPYYRTIVDAHGVVFVTAKAGAGTRRGEPRYSLKKRAKARVMKARKLRRFRDAFFNYFHLRIW